MRELLKTAARFYWAMALFGAQQLSETLSRGDGDRAAAAFQSVTRATEGELSDLLRDAFQAGDRLQRGLCDVAPGLLTPGTYTSRSMMRMSLNVMQQSAGVIGALFPSLGARIALSELQSKLQVFDLFENVDAVLGFEPGAVVPLEKLVERTSSLDSFTAVWATEGIGHYYAETVWETKGLPSGLLQDAAVCGVSARSLTPLHAGMGLSLANRLLREVRVQSGECEPTCDLGNALTKFVKLCWNNSLKGYVGAAYEGLGLVVRNLYPHLVTHVHEHLSEMGDHLTEYFWHGVGRAIYFAPTNYLSLSNSSSRAMEKVWSEPPDQRSRRNALAGLVWAHFLVNLRQPEIIESLLVACGDALDDEAFANGISSATVIWRDSTESDPYLGAVCSHQPDPSVPGLARSWREVVAGPSGRALNEYYSVLKEHDIVGDVFRYHALPQLMAELQSRKRIAVS